MSKTLQAPSEEKKSAQTDTQNAFGIILPRIGSGTFGEIFSLMSKESLDEKESILEPILENRAMRRKLAEEQAF